MENVPPVALPSVELPIEQQSLEQQVCPGCTSIVSDNDYFCPNCGKKLKDKPVSTSIGRQIAVYLISVLVPPFGLPWAFKYLKQGDEKSKIIGYVVIALTVISLIINIWLIIAFISNTNKAINNTLNSTGGSSGFGPLYSQ